MLALKERQLLFIILFIVLLLLCTSVLALKVSELFFIIHRLTLNILCFLYIYLCLFLFLFLALYCVCCRYLSPHLIIIACHLRVTHFYHSFTSSFLEIPKPSFFLSLLNSFLTPHTHFTSMTSNFRTFHRYSTDILLIRLCYLYFPNSLTFPSLSYPPSSHAMLCMFFFVVMEGIHKTFPLWLLIFSCTCFLAL